MIVNILQCPFERKLQFPLLNEYFLQKGRHNALSMIQNLGQIHEGQVGNGSVLVRTLSG